jgi:DNA-binding response OmpR family regulator
MLSHVLNPYYRVVAAKSGEEGLEMAQTQKIDLILLDIYMPGLSGFDVLNRLKTIGNEIPVIVITVSDSPDDQVQGMVLGAVDYIRKPISPDVVLQRVKLYTNYAPVPPPADRRAVSW